MVVANRSAAKACSGSANAGPASAPSVFFLLSLSGSALFSVGLARHSAGSARPASSIFAATVGTRFHLCWCGNASGGAAPKGCAETGAHGDVPWVLEEGITELASDVVEDLSGAAETVAENLKVSTLAVGARLKALGLISDANLEGVRVEVIGSGNLGGKNGRRRKEGRLLRGTVSET